MEEILNHNFYLHKECLKFAKRRVLNKKFSKNGRLTFLKKKNEYYLIDGYHRLMEHYVFDVELKHLNIIIKNNPLKITKTQFIHYSKYLFEN